MQSTLPDRRSLVISQTIGSVEKSTIELLSLFMTPVVYTPVNAFGNRYPVRYPVRYPPLRNENSRREFFTRSARRVPYRRSMIKQL